MIDECVTADDPRVQTAFAEMQQRILDHHPRTTFTIGRVGDMPGIWMTATVDLEDPDDIIDLFIDRLLEIQISEGLPIHILPEQTPERYAETRRKEHERELARRASAAPLEAVG
jgi:hypothetical protein